MKLPKAGGGWPVDGFLVLEKINASVEARCRQRGRDRESGQRVACQIASHHQRGPPAGGAEYYGARGKTDDDARGGVHDATREQSRARVTGLVPLRLCLPPPRQAAGAGAYLEARERSRWPRPGLS